MRVGIELEEMLIASLQPLALQITHRTSNEKLMSELGKIHYYLILLW